jgi:hypothetical protein
VRKLLTLLLVIAGFATQISCQEQSPPIEEIPDTYDAIGRQNVVLFLEGLFEGIVQEEG